MNSIRWFAAVLVCVAAQTARADDNKLPDEVVKALKKADELEIYSLGGDRNVKDGWHGATVLGKTTVKKDTGTVVSTVAKGVSEANAIAACFNPRHGIRGVHNGKTYDLLICFECGAVYVYVDGADKPAHSLMISKSPNKLLDKILTDAKVPLAKK
jgi:hypothetical protein